MSNLDSVELVSRPHFSIRVKYSCQTGIHVVEKPWECIDVCREAGYELMRNRIREGVKVVKRLLRTAIVWVRRVGYEVCMSLSSAVVRLAGTCLTIAIV